MKLPRGVRAKWLTFDDKTYTLLGKDMDSETTNLNPDANQKKNVLGETYIIHNGFTPESDIAYQVHTEDSIYKNIQEIVDELKSDDVSTAATMIVATLSDEVKNSDSATLTGTGYSVPVCVVPQDDGGDTSGYTINFNCLENGSRTKGTVSVAGRVPTFTPGTSSNG